MMQQTYFPTFVFACSKSTSLRRKTTLQLFVWAHSASIVILQTGTSKSMLFSAKRKSVYTYYEWARSMDNSLDSLDHLFHSLIIPLFTYGILVWGVASYDKYLSKIGKFQGRVVRFGFIKGAPPILSLLEPEASDKKLWKSITHSTKGLLADLLPPSNTILPNRGHSYVLPFKLGLNGLNAV